MSARAIVELYNRCDTTSTDWQIHFANALKDISGEEPGVLIGFGYHYAEDLNDHDDEAVTSHAEEESFYLKLRFVNAEAAYYQFPLFPPMDHPLIVGMGQKREHDIQHVRVDLQHPYDLQSFIEELRSNPHLVAIEESNENVFFKSSFSCHMTGATGV